MDLLLRPARTYGPRLAVVVVVWIGMALWASQFRGTSSFYAVLQNLPLLGLLALALTVTMITAELDLAVASIAACGGVVAAQVSDSGLLVSLLAGTGTGLAFGVAQGWLIGRLNMNSLVFTIGSLIVLRGLAYVFAGNNPVGIDNLDATDIFLERYWIFSFASLIALGVFVLVGLFLAFVRYGRELYAVGGGRSEAAAMGIPVRRAVLIAFTISGTCGGLAGAMDAMQGGAADPASYADQLLFGVAAALLGGVSLYGGRGTVINALLGVLLLGVISAALNAHGETQATTALVTGSTLLVVVALAAAAAGLADSRRRRQPLTTDVEHGGAVI